MKNNNKIVFFGSDENSAKLLDELIQANYNIELVITKTSKKTGRSQKQNPVKKIASQRSIKIIEKDGLNDSESITILENTNARLAILLSYGTIIPQKILNLFPLGIINIHPSFLPKYRGPSPVQTALLNGDSETGVSIMLLSKKMDAGSIIIQEKINIEPEDNHETLNQKLFSLGNKLLINNLDKYINNEIQIHHQDNNQATYAKMFEKKDGLIDWHNSAEKINNKIRAFYNWPGAYTYFDNKPQHLTKCRGKLLKIIEANINDQKTNHQIGEVFMNNDQIAIQTKNKLLCPLIVQIEGKQKTNINSFVNGYKNFIGSILK
ncbi:methionyl-tRNA formyltransferase [bacterium]|nr:methionyl-tRNA formyltransferase [bacterium]